MDADTDRSWTVAFLVMLSLTVVHAFVGLFFFTRRRRLHPIRGHSLGLITISSVSLTITAWTVCLPIIDAFESQCALVAIAIISGIFASIVQVVRGWRIIIFYILAVEKVRRSQAMRKNATNGAGDKSNQREGKPQRSYGLSRIHKYLTDRHFVSFTLALGTSVAFFGVLPLMVQNANLNVRASSEDFCPQLQVSNQFLLAVLGVGFINNSIILWKLRTISDAYCIKFDLGTYFIASCSAGIAIAIAATGGSNLLYGRVRVIIYVLSINLVLFVTTSWKVYKSMKRRKASASTRLSQRSTVATLVSTTTASPVKADHSNREVGVDVAGQIAQSIRKSFSRLDDVLANAEVLELFREHLKREWAVENLLFLEAVTDYGVMFEGSVSEPWRAATAADRIKMALSIYWTYIFSDAPSRINISSDTYHTLNIIFQRLYARCATISLEDANALAEHAIDPPPVDVFSRAAHEIRVLMEIDSFRNFKSSDLFSRHVASYPATAAAAASAATVSPTDNNLKSRHAGSYPAASPLDNLNNVAVPRSL